MCTVLQLSDLHVEPAGVLAYGQEDTAGKLPVVAGHALELAKDVGADVVVVTGDIACDGNETAYRQVADAFSIFDAAGLFLSVMVIVVLPTFTPFMVSLASLTVAVAILSSLLAAV